MTITREWLQSQISAIETVGITDSNTLEAFKLTLASLEAEPVGWFVKRKYMHSHPAFKGRPNAFPLYGAPPAPASVPDEIEPTVEAIKRVLPTSNPDEYAACIGADMWNACRAAMQGKVDSPVIPDSWVACSERIPEETNEPDGGATGYLVLYAEGKEPNGGFSVGVWNVTYLRQWWRGFITHWMPLPAAPQQEQIK